MKSHKFFLLIITLVMFFACKPKSERDIAVDNINELEYTLYGDTVITEIDLTTASNMIQAYLSFAEKFKEDSLAPEYMYKAADISMNINQGSQAILYLENIKLKYPYYKNIPVCLFLQAFIYEDQLQDNESASRLYNQFMEKYPNHELFDDAESSVNNMGKSLEEIIESFKLMEKN